MPFLKGISLEVIVIAWLEFELDSFEVAVQSVSNFTTESHHNPRWVDIQLKSRKSYRAFQSKLEEFFLKYA